MSISSETVANRESARRDSGQFGHQGRTAPADLASELDNSAPLARSAAHQEATRRAEAFRRAVADLEDLEMRHELANVVSEIPDNVKLIRLVRWDEEVNDDGGYDITLGETTDVDGAVTGSLSGYGSWSSKLGTGNVFAHDFAGPGDTLDVAKIRAWARTADGRGLEAQGMAFDAMFNQGEDAQSTLQCMAEHAGIGVSMLSRSDFETEKDLSDDEWDRLKPELANYDRYLHNSGARDSIDWFKYEAATRAGIHEDEDDQ